MSKDNIEYEVRWIDSKEKSHSYLTTSQTLAESKACKVSLTAEKATMGEWHLNIDGSNEDLLVMTKQAEKGELKEALFVSEKDIKRPSKKKAAKAAAKEEASDDELEVPAFLKRKASDPPRTLPEPKNEAPIPPKKKGKVKANEVPEEVTTETDETENTENDNMATKANNKKSVAKKTATKAAAKAKPVAKKARATVTPVAKKDTKRAPANWSGKAPNGKLDEAKTSLNIREGTNRAKAFEFLFNNKGKAVTRASLTKAVYGSASDDHQKALPMVIKGLDGMFIDNKVAMQVVRGDNADGEFCYGLFAK